MTGGPIEVFLDDVVRLRKPHPCGSFEWTVVRLGADIGLRCQGCQHRVMLPRRDLQKRLKTFVSRGPGYEAAVAVLAGSEASSARAVTHDGAADPTTSAEVQPGTEG